MMAPQQSILLYLLQFDFFLERDRGEYMGKKDQGEKHRSARDKNICRKGVNMSALFRGKKRSDLKGNPNLEV